ncbi:hypothetical protein Tco_1482481 [Tanacetum coccineum]
MRGNREDDSSISSSDEEDSDNEVEGTNVEGAKSDEEATYTEDQGNEAVKDTNTDLDGRDKVMTDVEDTHVTLTPVNPDGQQQSSSVSDVRELHRRSDLVEITDVSMRVFFVMSKKPFVLNVGKQSVLKLKVVRGDLGNNDGILVTLGGCFQAIEP